VNSRRSLDVKKKNQRPRPQFIKSSLTASLINSHLNSLKDNPTDNPKDSNIDNHHTTSMAAPLTAINNSTDNLISNRTTTNHNKATTNHNNAISNPNNAISNRFTTRVEANGAATKDLDGEIKINNNIVN
jgi:hypothetical protein